MLVVYLFILLFMPSTNGLENSFYTESTTQHRYSINTSRNSLHLEVPFLGINKSQTLNAGSTTLTLDLSLERRNTFVNNRGIHLTTNVDVSVYVTNYYYGSADTFLALPVNLLGVNYTIASYSPRAPDEHSEFMIVGVHDNTTVTITFPNGRRSSRVINCLDAYQETSDSDLTGTKIETNKLVSVVTGTSCAMYGCDMIMTQSLPNNYVGTNYIVPTFTVRSGSSRSSEVLFRVINTSYKNTNICVVYNARKQCSTSSLHTQNFEKHLSLRTPATVVATQPVVVAQYVTDEPFMATLPSVDQYLNDYYFTIPKIYSNYSNFMAISIPTINIGGLRIDGRPLGSPNATHTVSEPFDNYTIQIFPISGGPHQLRHTGNVNFGVLCYGFGGNYASYGFPAGFKLPRPDTKLDCGTPYVSDGYVRFNGRPAFHLHPGQISMTFMSRVNISCPPQGFIQHGVTYITCSTNGNWSSTNYSCSQIDCGKLMVPNAKVTYPSGRTTYRQHATIQCDSGYHIINQSGEFNKSTNCPANGTWEPPAGCERVDCGRWQGIGPHAQVTYQNDTKFQSTATSVCDTGYHVVKRPGVVSESAQCMANGNWSVPNYTGCELVDCGMWTGDSSNNNVTYTMTTMFNSTATASCYTGYNVKSTPGLFIQTATCTAYGKWSTPPYVGCAQTDCGMAHNPPNGQVSYNPGTTYNSTATYSCDSGYTLIGSPTRSCDQGGSWTGNTPSCVANVHYGSPTCFTCEDSTHVGLCDTVQRCGSNEICYLERYQQHGQIVSYKSGCLETTTCYKRQNMSLVVAEECVECCHDDFCNSKGCGDPGLPSREKRGPICFDCQHVATPEECHVIQPCHTQQVCGIEEFEWGDYTHYKMGCTSAMCGPLHTSASRASRATPVCKTCCKDDFCNQNCTTGQSHSAVIVG